MRVCEPSPRRASRGTVGAVEAGLSLFIHMRRAGGSSGEPAGAGGGSASDVDTLDLFNTHAAGRGKHRDACEEKLEAVKFRKTQAVSNVLRAFSFRVTFSIMCQFYLIAV